LYNSGEQVIIAIALAGEYIERVLAGMVRFYLGKRHLIFYRRVQA
jgi:hypothetical protein